MLTMLVASSRVTQPSVNRPRRCDYSGNRQRHAHGAGYRTPAAAAVISSSERRVSQLSCDTDPSRRAGRADTTTRAPTGLEPTRRPEIRPDVTSCRRCRLSSPVLCPGRRPRLNLQNPITEQPRRRLQDRRPATRHGSARSALHRPALVLSDRSRAAAPARRGRRC